MQQLVYDRTERNKGTASVIMLNRLETWTTYLAAQLRGYGYAVSVTPRAEVPEQTYPLYDEATETITGYYTIPAHTEWLMSDFPTRGEVDRIRRNVDALQAGFYSLPDWREIVYDNTLGYDQANALEWDLQRLYDWLRAMVSSFQMRQANTIFMQAGGILNA